VTLRAALALAAVRADAEDVRMKPFVLASRGAGDAAKAVEDATAKLSAAGFTVVGKYEPYAGAVVLAITSDELKAAATAARFGAYAAAQRVTVTRVGDEVQVAYTNPAYMAAAYRMSADLAPVAAKLSAALGSLEEYGPKDGKRAKDLKGYHYMIGMPYFDDPWKIASFSSQDEALQAVEAGLAAGRGGTKQVYWATAPPDGRCSGSPFRRPRRDANVMRRSTSPIRSTGHFRTSCSLEGRGHAAHAKFRIARNHTDLSMMGDHSFMRICCAPDS
jgi:hypothetical protein